MAIGKRKELSKGNSRPKHSEIWVNSCGLSKNQVANAVGLVLDSRSMDELTFYLVRTLYSDPDSILFEEGKRIAQK